jgi:hypothetical protein
MAEQKFESKGNLRLRVYPANAFANSKWPTVAELNAGLRLEDAVTWDGLEFGQQASETSDLAPISAKATVTQRAAANYGGSMGIWYPGAFNDNGNDLSLIWDTFVPDDDGYDRPVVWIGMSVDGEIGESGQPSSDYSFANGDYVSIYRVQADAWDDAVEGDDPFQYTINFLRNGAFGHYTVASTGLPVLAIVGTASGAAGGVTRLNSTVNGRNYTNGTRWSSSNPSVATVDAAGVVRRLSAGSATISASLPGSSIAAVTQTVTVS